jgi:hypothetical protein
MHPTQVPQQVSWQSLESMRSNQVTFFLDIRGSVRGTLVRLPFEFVYSQIPTYQEANGKSEKMYVIGTILNNVLNSGGRFLKENESREWVELDRIHAREKVGNTLRACCTMLDVYKKLE